MIGKIELRKAFENRPFVTKGYVMQRLMYKKYDQVNKFFEGLDHLGHRYLTEDVINNMLEYTEFGD